MRITARYAMTILINKDTGKEIDSSRMFSDTNKGIVVTNANCWKYIPKEKIEARPDIKNSDYYNEEKTGELLKAARAQDLSGIGSQIKDSYTEKARYMFGVKDLTFCDRKFARTSTAISSSIDVSDASYITISAMEEPCYNSSVEYYILDGSLETPILPEGIDYVENEKLFYNLTTRFIIDQANEEPKLYKNGSNTDDDYNTLTFEQLENDEYTISYKPGGEVHKYVPENDSIRIKLIIRNYTDIFSPAVISRLTINKYGGGLSWS